MKVRVKAAHLVLYKEGVIMNYIRLNDVWRDVNKEIGFYTTETFDEVPSSPGVYAWFYPLRITSENLNDFIEEVQLVLNYDCRKQGKPWRESTIDIGWDDLFQRIEFKVKKDIINSELTSIWSDTFQNKAEFDELRKVVMRASIFLPPLYVGKTINLKTRCFQHINGRSDDNNFHTRFEKYATLNNTNARRVSDLLFVSIQTKEESSQSTRTEELVELILKHLSKPKYSEI